MRDLTRSGIVAAAGAVAGFAAGFLVWGREDAGTSFSRVYSDGERVRVGTVIDGDTVVLEDGLHVRYRGSDTPEVYRFVRDPEPFAEAASARNRELVSGGWVTLRLPPSSSPAIDAHGRLLADVCLEGEGDSPPESVGETLVGEGLARADLQDVRGAEADRLRAAERAAREAKLGMWGKKKPRAAGFVASRKGKCAHRPDCTFAKRISPANLMRFNTLEAALETGRTRCPTCLLEDRAAPKRGGAGERPGAKGSPAQPGPSSGGPTRTE
ncbi:MAG: thermonuclease family protein [Planctomycetota bacterium]